MSTDIPLVWDCGKCFERNPPGEECCSNCGKLNIKKEASVRKSGDQNCEDEDLPRCSRCSEQNDSSKDPCLSCSSATMKIARVQPVPRLPIEAPNELRIVLIGRTGAGKSATANTVLDEKKFRSECAFESVTSNCQYAEKERFGKKILIVDTPGFFDTSTPKETIDEEMKKCVAMSSPGPQAFLLVTSLSHRFTKEEADVFDEMATMFGEEMTKYLIVVYTGRDNLDGSSVHDHVERCPEKLRQVIEAAGGGYVTFNNRGNEDEKEKDVNDLLGRIEEMVRQNGGDHFTSMMFKEAEEIMQLRIATKLEERREELEKEVREELLAEMGEKMRKERGYFQNVYEYDLQHVERIKKELAHAKENRGKKNETERECEQLLEDFAQKEVEIFEKKRRLLQKVEALHGEEKVRMQKKLADVGVRGYFQKFHEYDLQHVEGMKRELAAAKEKKGGKSKTEQICERLLEDLARKEGESLEKKRRLLQKIEALHGEEKLRMQKKLADVGVEIIQIVAPRKSAEEVVTVKRFSAAMDLEAQVIRKEERMMIEKEEADTSGRFTEGMKIVKPRFLNLFK